MSEIHLLKINYNDKDFSFIQDIRKSVFKDELQISEAELFDDFDNSVFNFSVSHLVVLVSSVFITLHLLLQGINESVSNI